MEENEIVNNEILNEEEIDTTTDTQVVDEFETVDNVEEPRQKADKKDSLIISLKKKQKELAEKLREKEEQEKMYQEKKKYKDHYMNTLGLDEETADLRATDDVSLRLKVERMEKQLKMSSYERQANKLENDYPEIMEDLDGLIDICEKTGWSLDKVCKAQYGEKQSIVEQQMKNTELLKAKQQKASVGNITTTAKSTVDSVKLSKEDEDHYQMVKKRVGYENLTRKEYWEMIK